jgi:hypothetical protein
VLVLALVEAAASRGQEQRDLRVPVREKLDRLRKLFAWLGVDRERVTVLEAARRLRALV